MVVRRDADTERSGISESLHLELAPLGLRSICIDPGYFKTDLLTADNRAPFQSRISDYESVTTTAHDVLNSKP
jgi:NAD(P)-dependent dehydrogenase (short-subunit alcohol dehydrogenase family)